MPRTVVPPSPNPALRSSPEGNGDRFPDKLVKYVPAETLAFFVPIAAAIGEERNALLCVVVAIGLVGTPIYLWIAASRLPQDQRPFFHFYPLAMLAFVAWALGTNAAVAKLVHLDSFAAGIIFGCAVFIIPGLDQGLTLWKRPVVVGDAKQRSA